MTNAQIIENLVAKITKRIEFYTRDMGMSLDAAKTKAREESVAGSAVWAAIDAKYSA